MSDSCSYIDKWWEENAPELRLVAIKKDNEVERLREVLKALSHREPGGCWCDHGIGSPMMTSHSRACEEARRALEADDE